MPQLEFESGFRRLEATMPPKHLLGIKKDENEEVGGRRNKLYYRNVSRTSQLIIPKKYSPLRLLQPH